MKEGNAPGKKKKDHSAADLLIKDKVGQKGRKLKTTQNKCQLWASGEAGTSQVRKKKQDSPV